MATTLDPTLSTNGQTVSPTMEIGVSGLRHFGGQLHEEWLPQLRSPLAWRAFIREASEQEPVIVAGLRMIELQIRQVSWAVNAASADLEAQREQEYVRTMLFQDMAETFQTFLSGVTSMNAWGWSAFEAVLKRRLGDRPGQDIEGLPLPGSGYTDGLYGVHRLAFRSQDSLYRWELSPRGDILGMIQADPNTGRILPMIPGPGHPVPKLLVFRAEDHKGSPEGRSLVRGTYKPVYYKKHIETLQGIGVERDLAGLPLLELPPNIIMPTTSQEITALEQFRQLGRNIRRDAQEAILWPRSLDEHGNNRYQFSLVSTGGQRQFDLPGIIRQFNVEIAMALMTDLMLLGHETSGNRSLSENKDEILASALSAICDGITSPINTQLIPWLWRLNGKPRETMPYLTHGEIRHVNLREFAAGLLDLSRAGFDLSDLDGELRRLNNWPAKSTTGQGGQEAA